MFTRQMAALFYRKESWQEHDVVLDMNYTDIARSTASLSDRRSCVEAGPEDGFADGFTTRINTPFDVWRSIASGEIAGDEALMMHLYSVEGDFDLMMHWDDYFGAATSAGAGAGGNDPDGFEGVNGRGGGGNSKRASEPKTNMLLLLIPWIVFWVVASIDGFWGQLGQRGGMRVAAGFDASDEGYVV